MLNRLRSTSLNKVVDLISQAAIDCQTPPLGASTNAQSRHLLGEYTVQQMTAHAISHEEET